MPRWLSHIWVPKLLLSPKKIRMFGPKTAILTQKMHFWPIWGKYRHCLLISFGALLVGCGARAAVTIERPPTYFVV